MTQLTFNRQLTSLVTKFELTVSATYLTISAVIFPPCQCYISERGKSIDSPPVLDLEFNQVCHFYGNFVPAQPCSVV